MGDFPPESPGLLTHWWAARHPPKNPETSFAKRIVLITGANTGLGFESALKFAKLGALMLILGVRSIAKGEEAKSQITQRTGYPAENIKVLLLDMAYFASVETFVQEVSERYPPVDVAVLNAGVAEMEYRLTRDWYETTLQVNVLSTALLGILLLPSLREATAESGRPSNLVLVGSASHQRVTSKMLNIGPEDNVVAKVNSKAAFNRDTQYAITKLLLMYVMQGLVSTVVKDDGSSDIVVTTVCPGLSMSSLFRNFSYLLKVLGWVFMYFFGRAAEEGSRTIVSGASLESEAQGQFWSHDVFYRKGDLVTSEEGKVLQQRTWDEIQDLLAESVSSTTGILGREERT